uniref:acyl-CoA dehydrogenase family protein n=1 Tax=Actinomadura roseirufa TaxID=2094049 RepID=UPI0010415488
MSWLGPVLDDDQRDLASMLDALAAGRGTVLDGGDPDPAIVAGLTAELADLGVWTLGTSEASGGGGADRITTAVALERLGRSWPALGWAAVQAHAAVDLLSGDGRASDLVASLHEARAAVAVVDAGTARVRLSWRDGVLAGSVDRIDAAAESPYLLVLDGDDRALLVPPQAMTATPLRRTGLGGAFTRSVDLAAGLTAGTGQDTGTVLELAGVDAAAARDAGGGRRAGVRGRSAPRVASTGMRSSSARRPRRSCPV